MGNKKWDDENLSLHPDTKYKGILYTARRPSPTDDDIPAIRKKVKKRKEPATPKEFSFPAGDALRGFFADRFVQVTALTCAAIIILSCIAIPTAFAKPAADIRLNDGGRVMKASTAARTVGEFLTDNKVDIGPHDSLDIDTGAPIRDGMEIILRRAMPVTVNTGGETLTVDMVAGTVQDVLDKAGVTPAPDDEVYPAPDTYVRAGMVVEHFEVEIKQVSEIFEIPYEKQEKKDHHLLQDEKKITQWGVPGELKITNEMVYKNGVLTSDRVISEDVLKEPVPQITNVGTYDPPPSRRNVSLADRTKSPGGTTPDGTPVEYTITMRVTAYCSQCNTGNKTAIGTYPIAYYTVAAIPSRFKYGKELFIPNFGYGRVEDTGGFTKDTIDVYIGDRDVCNCASEWKTGYYTVYVLE